MGLSISSGRDHLTSAVPIRPTLADAVLERWQGWMDQACGLAGECVLRGDVPVGALVISAAGVVVGRGWNTREAACDPTGHAEVMALRQAGEHVGRWHLEGCTLVVTLEPCTMCAGAIVLSRISRVVFGAWDEKAGACGSVRDVTRDCRLNHQVEVFGGVGEEKCASQLKEFFSSRRN